MPLTKPAFHDDQSATESEVFHPDPALSDQIARMTERALNRVAVDSAMRSAIARINDLENEIANLRAEAQWREAGWEEERAELRAQVHSAQLDATGQHTLLKQARLDREEQENELSCVRMALSESRQQVAALTATATTQTRDLQESRAIADRLHDQLLDRERILGAMWQTLQEYRAQGPIHRLLHPPDLPETQAPILLHPPPPEKAS